MIHWQNTKNPKLKGVAKDKDHFDRLKKLANGNLRIVSETQDVSEETKDLIDEVKNDAESTEPKKEKKGRQKKASSEE